MIVKDWDDNCHFEIYDVIDMSCQSTDVLMKFTKDQGTQQDEYTCNNTLDFPDGFNFIYVCE